MSSSHHYCCQLEARPQNESHEFLDEIREALQGPLRALVPRGIQLVLLALDQAGHGIQKVLLDFLVLHREIVVHPKIERFLASLVRQSVWKSHGIHLAVLHRGFLVHQLGWTGHSFERPFLASVV